MSVSIDPETGLLRRQGGAAILNPLDEFAIEEALRLREVHGAEVTAISMGPPHAESALRQALSYGVDNAVLLSDKAFAGADTWATAYTLARGIRHLGTFDLVICGKQAIDGDTAQVGPELAHMCDLGFVAWVGRIESCTSTHLRVHRMMEQEYHVVDVALPALISVLKDINVPRIPTIAGKLCAHDAHIPTLTAADIRAQTRYTGLSGSPTQIMRSFAPVSHRSRSRIDTAHTDPIPSLCAAIDEALDSHGEQTQ